MLGRLARTEKDQETARTHFVGALATFRRIGARQNEAVALEDLASVTTGAERDGHLRAAREIWLALDRPDRVARLDAG